MGSSLGCTCWDIFVNVVVYLKWLLTVGICCGGVLLRLLGVVVDLLGLLTVGGWFEVMVLWFGTTGRSPLVVVLFVGVFVTVFFGGVVLCWDISLVVVCCGLIVG